MAKYVQESENEISFHSIFLYQMKHCDVICFRCDYVSTENFWIRNVKRRDEWGKDLVIHNNKYGEFHSNKHVHWSLNWNVDNPSGDWM